MSLKINLKSQKKAQSSIEYLLLFAILLVITIIGSSNFFARLRDRILPSFYNKAQQAMK